MKTEQERIETLAQKIRDFNIVVAGDANFSGGFGELPPIGQGDITLDHIEKAFQEFKIVGERGVQAHGSLQQGYTFFGTPDCMGSGGGSTGGFPPSPPVPPILTGACCLPDGSCEVVTEAQCNLDGGDYQGDESPCEPNPCPLPPCCGGAFQAFDGSFRFFSTYTQEWSSDFVNGCTCTQNAQKIRSVDVDCNPTCTGFNNWIFDGDDLSCDPCSGASNCQERTGCGCSDTITCNHNNTATLRETTCTCDTHSCTILVRDSLSNECTP